MSKATLAPFNETKKAQQIYRNLWGGDDLHVGIYKPKKLSWSGEFWSFRS